MQYSRYSSLTHRQTGDDHREKKGPWTTTRAQPEKEGASKEEKYGYYDRGRGFDILTTDSLCQSDIWDMHSP